MAEVSADAMRLITISWQALNRAIKGSDETKLCDCTVIILFASIFIESNLNHIIDKVKLNDEMRLFFDKKQNREFHPGLQQKIGWFYNKFVASNKAVNSGDKSYKGIRGKLGRKFPGYLTICKFRNDISHGFIKPSVANVEKAKILRKQAKEIVNELFIIASKNGYVIDRKTTYNGVIRMEKGKNSLSTHISDPIIFLISSSSK